MSLACEIARGQLTGGWLEVTVHGSNSTKSIGVRISGANGWKVTAQTDATGHVTVALPYGRYLVSDANGKPGNGLTVVIVPSETTRVDVGTNNAAELSDSFGTWQDTPAAALFPDGFTVSSGLISRQPAGLTVPINFSGFADSRLTLYSFGAFSWTDTQFKLQGMETGDSYQPGQPELLASSRSFAELAVRTGAGLLTSDSYGAEVDTYLKEPENAWHGGISAFGTESALSSNNLPPPSQRGQVQQPERYNWLSRDELEAAGPVTSRADVAASVEGQWASQSVEQAAPGNNQGNRTLFGNLRGRIRATDHDLFELVFSRSSVNLSNWGIPAGLEALASRRDSPEFLFSDGVANEAERDNFNFFQLGWTHHAAGSGALGAIELRYGYSWGDFYTWPAAVARPFQSRIELLGSTVSGAPPLTNDAGRPRHEIASAWQPGLLTVAGTRHQIAAGATGNWASPSNFYDTPSNLNLVTAAGAAAYVVEYNTPADSQEAVHAVSSYVADHILLHAGLALNMAGLADFSRGSVRGSRGDLISWNSFSPRAGFDWQVPHLHRLVLNGSYFRSFVPLAGRYLDYGDPNSLSGSVYQWIDRNGDGWFTPDEQGALLMRFGGLYSSISPSLKRPYADEFDVGLRMMLSQKTSATVRLFRRDEKDRIAAINTGLGAGAFTPVRILDPGPDGVAGTFDDQYLTVYGQNPNTLGQDHYLLTNPSGLRTLNAGFIAQVRTEWHGLTLDASFTIEKAWGPTNPGNAYFENDPGVLGSLFADPNSTTTTLARSYVDRAYLGKLQALHRLPPFLGGVELATIVDYSDGLPFARELLVTGLPQGPFLIATTVRGSPQGGNQAQHLLNWNLRLQREFESRFGRFSVVTDILNVNNSAQQFQQIDLTGPLFNERLPTAIQPARFVRLGVSYRF